MYSGPHLYGMWYYYSPLFASILVPFTFLPLPVLKLVWLFFSLFMLYRILRLTLTLLGLDLNSAHKGFIVGVAIVTIHPVFLNLLHGQMTILVLWCCIEGCWQLVKSNYFKSGAAFGIGINVKILPVFFLYGYLLRKNIKALFSIVGFVILFALLPYLFINTGFHTALIEGWFDMINPMKAEHINTTGEGGFIDFASLITKYFTSTPISNERQLNIFNLTEYEVFVTQTAFRACILIYVAWFMLKLHQKILNLKIRQFADLALLLMCIPIAFPHQRDYSILLCTPSFIFILYSWFHLKFRPSSILMVALLMCVTAMGSTFFLELIGHRMKVFIYETRLNGIGALFFMPLYLVWWTAFNKFLTNESIKL